MPFQNNWEKALMISPCTHYLLHLITSKAIYEYPGCTFFFPMYFRSAPYFFLQGIIQWLPLLGYEYEHGKHSYKAAKY